MPLLRKAARSMRQARHRYVSNRCDRCGLRANLPTLSGKTSAEFFDEPVSPGDVQFLHVFEFDQQLSCQLRIMAVALQLRDDFPLSTNVFRTFGYVSFGFCQMAQEDGSVHCQMLSGDARFS
jgi:hypothetical protein